MKDLRIYITENNLENLTDKIAEKVFESFGSEKLADVFRNRNGKITGLFGVIGREMQWDKILDDDIEEMSTEDARKLAYKKNSDDYIVWLDNEGKFLGRSIGNFWVFIPYTPYTRNIRNTVKSLSISADKALVIKDPSRFDTRDLRRQRNEQKRGALALMDDAQVLKDNLKRYKEVIDDHRMSEMNLSDTAERVKLALDKVGILVKQIADNAVTADSYADATDELRQIQNDTNAIITRFSEVLNEYKNYEIWKRNAKTQDVPGFFKSEIVDATDHLDKKIDEFNEKYIDEKVA